MAFCRKRLSLDAIPNARPRLMPDREQKRLFSRHGLRNVSRLFSTLEVERDRQYSTDLRAADSDFGHSAGIEYGSYTDATTDHFRRAHIGHYIARETRAVARYCHPVLQLDGGEIERDGSQKRDLCGR